LVGLCLETTLLTPLAIGLLLWTGLREPLTVTQTDGQSLFVLSIVGLVTVAPLLMFAYAAQRIRLSTMGMGQYIVPSAHFGLAIYYDEPVTRGLVAGFGLIWTGLILYSISAQRRKAIDGSDTE
jgi:chloramphenicol-sensitive protein RarD